jgi:ABC-type transporter Mla MlaB component
MNEEKKTQLRIDAINGQTELLFKTKKTGSIIKNPYVPNYQVAFSSKPNIAIPNEQTEGIIPLEPSKWKKSEWKKISLGATLTLAHSMDLKQQLDQCHGSRVQLWGGKVKRIDTAALQLLLAFINRPDVTVGWIAPSPELCRAAHLLGLTSHLGLQIHQGYGGGEKIKKTL